MSDQGGDEGIRWQRFQGRVYLFIYMIRHAYDEYDWEEDVRFCTVFALAERFEDAELIAINCVHQHGWRVLKTDTATAFDVDDLRDNPLEREHFMSLMEYGASFLLVRPA